MTTGVDEKIQQGDCFRLLAACFYEPEIELFLQEHLCDNLAVLLAASDCEAAATAASRMKQALKGQNDEYLKVEHARLFVGPFELVAPPYGSVYLEDGRMLMGDSTMAVQKVYQAYGLAFEVMEPPDHIALELEFMHYLCHREAEASAKENQEEAERFAGAQAHFMRKFLGPWIPGFCANIRKGTESSFYRHLADCLEGFASAMTSRYRSVNAVKEAGHSYVSRVSF